MLFEQVIFGGFFQKNRWNPCKGFDVVENGRLVVKAVGLQFRRTISRFRSFSLERLDQCGLFTTDVTARTDKHLDPKGSAALEYIGSQRSEPLGLFDRFLKPIDLFLIFVPDVNVSLLCSAYQSGHRHAFDQQMGSGKEDFAILKGSRFAFVGVAHDVLGLTRRCTCFFPFGKSGSACTSHTEQTGNFEGLNHAVVARVEQKALHRRVSLFDRTAAVAIDFRAVHRLLRKGLIRIGLRVLSF